MPRNLSAIKLQVGKHAGLFLTARRTEALGGRVRWELYSSDFRIEPEIGLLPQVVDPESGLDDTKSGPSLAGPLSLEFPDEEDLDVRGPFRVVECQPDGGYWRLTLEQTVEQVKHNTPKRSAQVVQIDGAEKWLSSSDLNSLLTTLDDPLRGNLLRLFGAEESVILQVDQTDVELAAWLAWSATFADKSRIFWLVGQPGSQWSLASSDCPTDAPPSHFELGPSRMIERFPECRYLRVGGVVTSCACWNEVDRAAIANVINGGYLPRRIDLQRPRWVVLRHDTWTTGVVPPQVHPIPTASWGTNPVPWLTQFELSDRTPQPWWTPSPLFPRGRLMGKIAAKWTPGESTIACTMEGCEEKFPLRITTFDAGSGSATGWQWVPSKGNIVCVDPDWSLSSFPSLRYVERQKGIGDPYSIHLSNDKVWLAKFGPMVMKFFKKGLHLG